MLATLIPFPTYVTDESIQMKKSILLATAFAMTFWPAVSNTTDAQIFDKLKERASSAVGSGTIEGVISKAPDVGTLTNPPPMHLTPQQTVGEQYDGSSYTTEINAPEASYSHPSYDEVYRPIDQTDVNHPQLYPAESCAPQVAGQYVDEAPLVGESYFTKTKRQWRKLCGKRNRDFRPSADCGNSGVTRLVGLNGLLLRRDYDTNVSLSTNPSGDFLTTPDANSNNFSGADVYLINRSLNGKGWETRYFGLFDDPTTGILPGNAPTSQLRGLDNLNTGIGNLATVIDTPGVHSVTRDNEIHNAEFNLLRRLEPRVFGCRFDLNERILGFRYFRFQEGLSHRNQFDAPVGAGNFAVQYDANTENDLYGFQLGRRMEKSLGSKLGIAMSAKGGVFGNRAQANQSWTTRDVLGNRTGVATVANRGNRDYEYGDSKTDLAFLGEFDAGVTYNLGRRARARGGYRVLGVTDVALADDQIPTDFTFPDVAENVNTNGDLFMHGAYFGIEFVR